MVKYEINRAAETNDKDRVKRLYIKHGKAYKSTTNGGGAFVLLGIGQAVLGTGAMAALTAGATAIAAVIVVAAVVVVVYQVGKWAVEGVRDYETSNNEYAKDLGRPVATVKDVPIAIPVPIAVPIEIVDECLNGDPNEQSKYEWGTIKKKIWKAHGTAVRDNKIPFPYYYQYSLEVLNDMIKNGTAAIGWDGLPMEVHHILPRTDGGSNSYNNYRIMARSDHRLKDNYCINHKPPYNSLIPNLYEYGVQPNDLL